MDSFEAVLKDTIDISYQDFVDAVDASDNEKMSVYSENTTFNMSIVTELIGSAMEFRKVNQDATTEDVKDFITACLDIPESLEDFYINNNEMFNSIRFKLAMQRDALYNPLMPLSIVDYKCGNCGNDKAYFWVRQTRSSDEPLTVFHQCTKCRKRM